MHGLPTYWWVQNTGSIGFMVQGLGCTVQGIWHRTGAVGCGEFSCASSPERSRVPRLGGWTTPVLTAPWSGSRLQHVWHAPFTVSWHMSRAIVNMRISSEYNIQTR